MAKPLGRTLHGDPNLGVLTAPQQPTPGKFRVSSVAGFEPRTMCHLLGPHFPVFALTNWATLAVKKKKKTWKAALLCLFWTLWPRRNKTYDNYESMGQTIN